MSKAFLQQICGEWFDDFVYHSKEPLKRMGFEIIPFEDLNEFRITKKDIVIGSIDSCKIAFDSLGIKQPPYLGFPACIQRYLGRNISIVNYENIGNDFPFFIKPYDLPKQGGITGSVVENTNQLELLLWGNGEKINKFYKSEVVNFISEYRCFISEGKLVGAKHYQGDFTKIVDFNVVNNIIKDYIDSPISYTIDVGLTDNNQTLLVELNDMYGTGSYGLDGKIYTSIYKKRWFEILNNEN